MHVITKYKAEAQLLAQFFCASGANVSAKTNSMESVLDFARGLDVMTLTLNYYEVNGPYAKNKWHSCKKVLWAGKTNHIWGKLPQTLLREACSFM